MPAIITTKSPVFWAVVCAGVILPALALHGVAQVVATVLVVTGIVRARRQHRAATEQR